MPAKPVERRPGRRPTSRERASTQMDERNHSLPDTDELYEHAACGLLLCSADGTIRRANRRFCAWLGYEPGELAGRRRVQDLLTMGGRIFHQTHWTPLLHMQGSLAEVKLDLLHRDGRSIPMMLNVQRRRHEAGSFDEIALFIAEDRSKYERELVAARRRAEELLALEHATRRALTLAQARLRLALDSAQLGVWDVDPATGERHYEGVGRLLGLRGDAVVPADRFHACIEPRDRGAEARAFAAALDGSSPDYRATYRLNGVDGAQRVIDSWGRASFDDSGRLERFVGVLQDATEPSRRRAQAVDRARLAEQMVGIVSHDLRNPLSAIQMSAHVLGRGELSANQRRVLGRILTATERAGRLIADLLDFTQARLGGRLPISPRIVDLHAATHEAVDELALAFPGRALVHRLQGDGVCMADPDRLAQLLGNLVANATSYGAVERPVTVTSRIGEIAFELEVHNEGEPIPPGEIDRLFEPMVRGADGASVARSVGLGLFIVQAIARAHGGDIEVRSSAAEGTSFVARMPRRLQD